MPNIRAEMFDVIDQDIPRAYNEVKEIAVNPDIPASVRLKACERIFSLAGMEAPKQIEIKIQRIDSLSNDDLLREIESIQKDIKDVNPDYEVIDV